MIAFKLWALLGALSLSVGDREPFTDFGGTGDNNFWFLVGIYDGTPGDEHQVAAGAVLSLQHVITSATPMRRYDDPDMFAQLVVYYRLNRYRPGKVKVESFRIHSDHKDVWSAFDPFSTHSDLAILKTEKMYEYVYEGASYWQWGCVQMALTNETHEIPEGEIFKGHLTHVSWGSQYYSQWRSYGSTSHPANLRHFFAVDCTDYIPKEWGIFICLLMDPDMIGCDSGSVLSHYTTSTYYLNKVIADISINDISIGRDGSPLRQMTGLFWTMYDWVQNPYVPLWYVAYYKYKYWMYGICSFAIKRDQMNVFVFTDMTKEAYRNWTIETRLGME